MSRNFSVNDEKFMRRALELAQRGRGLTSPNPCVGAVLVRNGRVLGEGFHHRAGANHAEVEAVGAARKKKHRVAGATLYVTLEPCCTHGRTPPCTDLIRAEKIARVVVAAKDPNPCHAGRGFLLLRRAGITVETGLLRVEAERLNRAFNWSVTHDFPWVVAKIALSLDGKISTRAGDDRWLTSAAARRKAHELRHETDAIVVGAETVRQDDPQLTVRLLSRSHKKIQPWRVVLTRRGELPAERQIFHDKHAARTLVFQGKSLRCVLADLHQRGVRHALLEGGGRLLGAAFEADLVNEVAFFLAPLILGTSALAVAGRRQKNVELIDPHFTKSGPDFFCQALVAKI